MTRRTFAEQADTHVLYQKSVQAPEAELEFFDSTYRQLRGKSPLILHEDFCGTAYLCVEWCKSDFNRRAIGVDLSQDTLVWAEKNNIQPAGPDVASRIMLVNGNVLDSIEQQADIISATNFSYSVFKTRASLGSYFKTVHSGLHEDGLFIMDMFGGTETFDAMEEEREVEDEEFTYIWEQERFNPITHEILCHIHFLFADGSRIDNAFSYDWRLWTIPELRELLLEAGFRKVRVFWEEFEEDEEDEDNEYLQGTGNYVEVQEVENQESWVNYIVAEK